MQIIIDKEFQSLIPPLTVEEYEGLEKSILSEGCRDAIVLWEEPVVHYDELSGFTDIHGKSPVIIDGHNRYEICTRHNIPFNTVYADLHDRNEVKIWMMRNQLARRNLNDFQRIEITHKCEDAVKEKAKERQESTRFGGGGNISTTDGKARDELGAMAGVSGKTYEHAVTVMEEAPEPIIEAARRNDLSINAAYEVTRMDAEEQQELIERMEQGETPKDVFSEIKHRPHVTNNSGNNEWYTPADYISLAREVMGGIDLDPATSEIAQETVNAKTYYTAETNGLDKPWGGRVWMNPPYASDLIGRFVDKLIEELPNIEQAIVLVNNATETEWFNKMISRASAVCFPRSRLKFYMPDGKTGAPLQGQALLYFGRNSDGFIEKFSVKGWCAIPK